ncbi:MAG: S-methyl-5'-thioadenosine phosphorylase [Planctomycetes bacterium]|nr:S-methyl-5'-thioadenosine phosphorylase [Planctomycetota bacterium]MCB9917679.1 S-methyl-5'-thioadenosine phosphorylase [Planctomycetota bacterium]
MQLKKLGVIGGSGLYEMDGLTDVREIEVETPFGKPSDILTTGQLGDAELVFLPRHGKGHRLMPSELPFQANVYAMKMLEVQGILAISAVGSLREEIVPGHLVVVDQFIDRTRHRADTFFGDGIVGHVHFADPICTCLGAKVFEAASEAGATVHEGGTYVCMEGPQFSTRAESHLYRSWGASVIGMTNLQEAKLAREAGLCYSTLALATDYDCWHDSEADVSVEAVLEVIKNNVSTAKAVIAWLARSLPMERTCHCARALEHAIMTAKDRIPEHARRRLEHILPESFGGLHRFE